MEIFVEGGAAPRAHISIECVDCRYQQPLNLRQFASEAILRGLADQRASPSSAA